MLTTLHGEGVWLVRLFTSHSSNHVSPDVHEVMVKKKLNRSSSVAKKKRTHDVKLNPFEVRVNRKKQNVLGQKIERNERGLPGVSRSRAIQKRKKTLLKEYRNRDKRNSVVDKRFGESNEELSQEEKMIQRQIMQAKRRQQRASIYNLEEEEEELTHYGQSLGDMESFDDLQLSSDDNEVDDTETHFGGFLKKKKQAEGASERGKTRKEAIEEIVAKSKLYKFERQKEKEKIEELLEVMDDQWKNIQSLVVMKQKPNEKKLTEVDDYDRYLLELETQPRAMASERMKTEEELAKNKKEKLETLEQKRQLRMRGERILKEETVSGDYDIRSDPMRGGDKREMVRYHNGNMVFPPGVTSLLDSGREGEQNETDKGESSEDEEGYIDGDKEEEPSDRESEREDSGQEDQTVEDPEVDCSSDIVEKDVPYVYKDVPCTDQDLFSLLADAGSPTECGVILDRVISCHDPALSPENVRKMEALFSCLLSYCLSLTENLTLSNMEAISHLAKPLFKSGRASPTHTASCVQCHLKESFRRYQKLKKGKCEFPSLRDLLLFQIVGLLFPSSDFRHPVTTPTIHLMTLGLSKGSVQCVGDVIKGSFICQTLLEYISLSKRFIPELANFVASVLSIFASSKGSSCTVIPPFTSKSAKTLQKSLSLSTDQSLSLSTDQSVSSLVELISDPAQDNSSSVGLSLLTVTVKQADQLASLWQHSPSFDVVFVPMKHALIYLKEVTDTSSEINTLILTTLTGIENGLSVPKPILQLLRQKPKSITFFEPVIDESYQPGKKRYSRDKRVSEQFKLKHRHKRELKGAVREIRKDNKFLAREKMKEQLEKDTVRKNKVKQIYGWLQQEHGESKSERLKTRKKTDNKDATKK